MSALTPLGGKADSLCSLRDFVTTADNRLSETPKETAMNTIAGKAGTNVPTHTCGDTPPGSQPGGFHLG